MKLLFSLVLILVMGSGCATGFKEAQGNSFGYKIKALKDSWPYFTHYAYYIGNASTKKSHSEIYTQLAAVKFCAKKKQNTILTESTDHSSPHVSTELGSTTNGGLYTYKTLKTLPSYSVLFRCDDKMIVANQGPRFKTLGAEIMKDYVDDFGAALQVNKLNTKGPLLKDDVVVTVNDIRVKNTPLYYKAIRESTDGFATFLILRKKKEIKLQVPVTNNIASAKATSKSIAAKYCKTKLVNSQRNLEERKEYVKKCIKDLAEEFGATQ